MSDLIRVRDREKNIIRTITRQAYMAMGPKVYEKLGSVDPTTEIQAEEAPKGNVHRSVSAPVIRPQIKATEEQASEREQAETTQAETEKEVNEPKRRGRTPGSKNKISSVATHAEK